MAKKSISKYDTARLGVLTLLIALVAASFAGLMVATGSSNTYTTPLVAGQYYAVGEVSVWTEVSSGKLYLHVKYEITDPKWYLTEVHLAVARDLREIPRTRAGNPIPGLFPYKAEGLWDRVAEFTVDLTDVFGLTCPDSNETTLYIAAHAVVAKVDEYGNVLRTETAWGQGTRFTSRGSWGMYFTYTVICEEYQTYCEMRNAGTAWAYGNPFPGASWAMYVVYEGGNHATDLILGQHRDIGDVSIWREGNYLYVRIVTSSSYYLNVTHIHVATSLSDIPQNEGGNPKVGRFEYQATVNAQDFTATIPLDSSEASASTLYVAIHASIYEYVCS